MKELAAIFHRVGSVLCLGTFACTLLAALNAGVDPLAAVARSVAGSTALVVLYVALCRTVVPLFGAGEAAPATDAAETTGAGSD